MGISATYCRLCAIPAEHDHYVPSVERPGMLRIVRAGETPREPGLQAFPFTAEHAWLLDKVALDDEGEWVFHAHCWELIGKPARRADALHNGWNHFYALHEAWHRQLFDFFGAVRDGVDWWLADPKGTSAAAVKNRARLARAVAAAERHREDKSGAQWRTIVREDDERSEHLRYRIDIRRGVSVGDYPHMVCLIQEYGAAARNQPAAELRERLEQLEIDVKAAVERESGAMFVAAKLGGKQPQLELYAYAADPLAVKARLAAIAPFDPGRPFEFDVQHDARWDIYFGELVDAR
jgi:hypothetical protein